MNKGRPEVVAGADKPFRGWVCRGYGSAGHTVVCTWKHFWTSWFPPASLTATEYWEMFVIGFLSRRHCAWGLPLTAVNCGWVIIKQRRHVAYTPAGTNIKCRFLSGGKLFRPLMKFMTIHRDKKYEGKPFDSCWWFLMQLYIFFTSTQKPHVANWQSADGSVIKIVISRITIWLLEELLF